MMQKNKIKVLIVDDSRVSRELMSYLLQTNPNLEIVGMAEDGLEALKLIEQNPPDLVFTDIVMPKMNGFELTRRIMEKHPIPVVVVSGIYNKEEIEKSFKAIDAGALAILEKPRGLDDKQFYETARFITDTVKILSITETAIALKNSKPENFLSKVRAVKHSSTKIEAIAIGASIGGPKALQKILSEIPNSQVPIFIVQHIAPGFIEGFCSWLSEYTKLKIQIAKHGERAIKGYVYVAPDKIHMEVGPQGVIKLVPDISKEGYVPSVSKLFRSIADVYGKKAVGVLLLGLEKDGPKELHYLHEKGALTVMEESNHFNKKTSLTHPHETEATVEEIAKALKELMI